MVALHILLNLTLQNGALFHDKLQIFFSVDQQQSMLLKD